MFWLIISQIFSQKRIKKKPKLKSLKWLPFRVERSYTRHELYCTNAVIPLIKG